MTYVPYRPVDTYDGKHSKIWNISHPEVPKSELSDLYELLANPDVELEGHNIKTDILWLEVFLDAYSPVDFPEVKCSLYDTMTVSSILNIVNYEYEKNDLETLAI